LEETRAWAHFEVVEILHQREEREWVGFGRIRQRSEKPPEPAADIDPNEIGRAEVPEPKVARSKLRPSL
jgi:hypothetical protein